LSLYYRYNINLIISSHLAAGAIWVGAQENKGEWKWLNEQTIKPDQWKNGKPHPHPARKCVILDSRDRYLATNFFCGEKFSFICEHEGAS